MIELIIVKFFEFLIWVVLSHPKYFLGGESFQRFNSPCFPFYNSCPCCSKLVSRRFTFAEWIGLNWLSPKYFEYYVEISQYLFGVKFDLTFPLTFNQVMFVLTLALLLTTEELNSCGPHGSVKVIPHRWWVKNRASCTEPTMSIFMGKQTNSSSLKKENKKDKKRWSWNAMLNEWDGTRDICFSVMTHWPRFAQSILHDLRLNSTQSSPSHSVSKFLKFKGVLYDCMLLTKSSFNTLVHTVFIRVLSFSVGGQSHVSGSSQVDAWPFLDTVSTD